MDEDIKFNLELFEKYCYNQKHEEAIREFINILKILDKNYGALDSSFSAVPLLSSRSSNENVDQHVLTRITAATSTLFADPNFMVSEQGFLILMPWHRWISSLFASSPFKNADHVIRSWNIGEFDNEKFEIPNKLIAKLCLLYSPESEIPIDPEAIWNASPVIATNLFLALMSPRFLGSPAAHSKREVLLKWFPDKLNELESLDGLPVGILHDVYMHCSYADYSFKHNITKPINKLVRNKLIEWGFKDLQFQDFPEIKSEVSKPIMMVILEWFAANHSIYRTHSTTLKAAREHFHLVGVGMPNNVDEAGRNVFDEFFTLENTGDMFQIINQINDLSIKYRPRVLYMPSVGMFPLTMFVSNLRFAPLQVMALGHPATTHSKCIDYVVVEEDYVGDPSVFSEKLLVLASDALPYVPSAAITDVNLDPVFNPESDVVHVAVCLATMKINPGFLAVCKEISTRAKQKVNFHFLIGQAIGVVKPQIDNAVNLFIKDCVTIYGHQNYKQYLECIKKCDLFINPFPFGNTNGIVDTVSVGLVGVCRIGPEVHEHIDKGMFERLGLPSWMITYSSEEYIQAAIRLIDNYDERMALRHDIIENNKIERLFKGRPNLFGEEIFKLVSDEIFN